VSNSDEKRSFDMLRGPAGRRKRSSINANDQPYYSQKEGADHDSAGVADELVPDDRQCQASPEPGPAQLSLSFSGV
jgi:hypothetical protein